METKFDKVPPDSPDRCQSIYKNGQCPFQKVEGTDYCKMHQGASKASCNPEKALRNYNLTKWQEKVNRFADSTQIKSLREEIGISRMILENIVNKCEDESDLLLYSTKISDHITKIEKVVASCHRLELSNGMLLDKNSILQIAGTITEIIGRYIQDSNILESISNEIVNTIVHTQTVKALQDS